MHQCDVAKQSWQPWGSQYLRLEVIVLAIDTLLPLCDSTDWYNVLPIIALSRQGPPFQLHLQGRLAAWRGTLEVQH